MATVDQIAAAVAVIKEVAGNPSVGFAKDTIDFLEGLNEPLVSTPANEVRVVESKETR